MHPAAMPPPFNRWDSARYACGAAFLLAALAGGTVFQSGGWGWRGTILVGSAAAGAAFVLSGLLTRSLPPDMALRRLTAAERQAATAPPAPATARLRVARPPGPLDWSRMDIYLDGARVGQLRAGMAFVVPLRPGLRELSARVWLRRIQLRDQVNALPGTDTDIAIHVSGSKERSYSVDRQSLQSTLRDGRTILVRPAVSQA